MGRHLKEVILYTYFGQTHRVKPMRGEVFDSVTNKLKRLHYLCFKDSAVRIKLDKDLTISGKKTGKILIGFHTVAAYRRLLRIARETGVKKFGIVARERESVVEELEKNYDLQLKDSQNSFKIEGISVKILVLENSLSNHSKLAREINAGRTLFFSYDVPATKEDLSHLVDEFGNPKEPEKFVFYEYNGQKVLMVSTYLLYLMQRTGAAGLPIYTRRARIGTDIVSIGEQIRVGKDENIEERAREIYKRIFDFMSKNILDSARSSVNIGNLAKITALIRKNDREAERKKWKKKYWKKDLRLTSPVLIDPLKKGTFLLTSTSPVKSVKVSQFTKEIVAELENSGGSVQKLEERFSKQKLEPVLAKLWNTGIVEKVDK